MLAYKSALLLALAAALFIPAWHPAGAQEPGHEARTADNPIASIKPRAGRTRPVVAVIGDNSGTEMTDFVIPYSILKESGSADVLALAARPGPVSMRPTSLKLLPQDTLAGFDLRYPDGADVVVVPAVAGRGEPELLAWLAGQAGKGATVVGICDGAFVLARAGLLQGRRGTAHWFTHEMRGKEFPDTTWLKNVRYVVDGKVVTSAGISAALPTSLALVEAIGGREQAAAIAARYGIEDWSAQHDSDKFVPKFGTNLSGHVAVHYTNGWLHASENLGIPVRSGVDDLSLALAMDAWSRTGRSRAYALVPGGEAFTTRNGLRFVASVAATQRILPALAMDPVAGVFDRVLDGIEKDYGRRTADGVAYDFEYTRRRD